MAVDGSIPCSHHPSRHTARMFCRIHGSACCLVTVPEATLYLGRGVQEHVDVLQQPAALQAAGGGRGQRLPQLRGVVPAQVPGRQGGATQV